MEKFFWCLDKIWNYIFVNIRILIYGLFHPRKILELSFSVYSTINEFYKVSHGQLLHFEDSEFFKKISKEFIFAKCNVFNRDANVTRSAESQVLAALVQAFDPQSIFEFGTYNGFTTLHLAENSMEDAIVYTLDLPKDFDLSKASQRFSYSYDDKQVVRLSMNHIEDRLYKGQSQERKIKELFGDSYFFDFTAYHGKIDLIFIDGNHSYQFVKSDTENALKMLSPKGVIVWHDYDYIVHKDVFKYLNELSKELPIYSIPHTRFAIYGKHLK